MCMADDSFGRRIPFAFLQDIKERFLATYSKERANTAMPYGMNEFAKVIGKQMVCIICIIGFICNHEHKFNFIEF